MLKLSYYAFNCRPLIRIIGDRFPWQVKSAILSTLSIIIRRGGIALKPFLPQLQTTFVKCLQDNTRTIRSSAALALGKLSALSTRVDPLVGDLLSGVQTSDVGIREATLTALKGVIKHAGGSVSIASRTRVYTLLNDLIHNDDDQIRSSAASIFELSKALLQEKLLVHNKQLCNQSVVHLLIATKKANSFQVQ
ncbi:PREDICTED: eIF-2-alpha kinase activator GCN1-like [Nicotiana attenuata]|uniref:eIF-2-alpha kinase activator GCN1-like n=1 Tax=Nicotiana attenuata TaxID=49451 RepID=UPI0009049F92|nr:PREDICTED: eIF-2-alpha kinase activator GCN1-like [Nicotiana attenuata]